MSDNLHKLWQRYDNNEDRHNGLLKSKRKYAAKDWTCEICKTTVRRGNKSQHINGKTHKKLSNTSNLS